MIFRLRGLVAAAAVAVAALVPAPAHAEPGYRSWNAVLERVSPTGTISVNDKECFTLTVKGHGFMPLKDGARRETRAITIEVVSALRGEKTVAYPDQDGNLRPTTLHPCGITTHGGTSEDHTCKGEDRFPTAAYYRACSGIPNGGVVTAASSWTASRVTVTAVQEDKFGLVRDLDGLLKLIRQECGEERLDRARCDKRLAQEEYAYGKEKYGTQAGFTDEASEIKNAYDQGRIGYWEYHSKMGPLQEKYACKADPNPVCLKRINCPPNESCPPYEPPDPKKKPTSAGGQTGTASPSGNGYRPGRHSSYYSPPAPRPPSAPKLATAKVAWPLDPIIRPR
ncbi:hypothetical protein OK074_4674 [Actinobacteria bacterium OK074]|nr:hypothetical protein OK074_4674 [Actinobacteria bacterium OK074]